VKSLPNKLGTGILYWGAEYQAVGGVNEAGFDTASFFDSNGNVLSAADAIGGMSAPLLISASLIGSNVRLSWPFSGAACQLLTSTNLLPSAVWSSLTGSTRIEGARFAITVPAGATACFYRLQSN